PASGGTGGGGTAAAEPGFLQALPRPPDEPRSLFAPPPPPGPPPPDLERPYFLPDPLLDPPQLPPVGWFAGLDLGILTGHVTNQLMTAVQNPATGNADQVGIPSAGLNWTVSPRVEVGYRLPSAFGEFALSYRGLATQGSQSVEGTDVPTRLSSHLDINQIDL